MPFESQAQRRKFYATPKLRKYIPEFEAATPAGAKLPQHISDSVNRVMGGKSRAKKRRMA